MSGADWPIDPSMSHVFFIDRKFTEKLTILQKIREKRLWDKVHCMKTWFITEAFSGYFQRCKKFKTLQKFDIWRENLPKFCSKHGIIEVQAYWEFLEGQSYLYLIDFWLIFALFQSFLCFSQVHKRSKNQI